MVEEIKDDVREAESQSNQEPDLKVLNDELQNRVAQLEEGIASRDGELTALKESLTGAVAKYRTAVLANAPEVPADLIKGDSIEAMDVSLATAKGIVAQVKQQLQGEAQATLSWQAGMRSSPTPPTVLRYSAPESLPRIGTGLSSIWLLTYSSRTKMLIRIPPPGLTL